MTVEQVYVVVNTITQEVLGESVVVNEDLSNLVDIGRAFVNANSLDNFVRALNDHIGRVIFVDRVYSGRAVSVLRDGWEYGSMLEKVRANLPEATENESWDLVDGQSYDPNVFYKPSISVKFYNDRVTFEIPISITERQVKSAFSNAQQMNGLISLIHTSIANAMTVKLDALIMRTINAGIGETIHDAGATRAVNLLALYNASVPAGEAVTVATALQSSAFMRFAVYTIKNYMRRMADMSTLFNIGGAPKFTPADRLHAVMLDEFKNSAEIYLYDGLNQFNTDGLRLPSGIETVAYWQGSGTSYAFADTSSINVKTPSGDTVAQSGILCVLFDHDALGVANLNRRVTTDYNAKAEFWNEWHKMDAGYFLDLDENFVCFYIGA